VKLSGMLPVGVLVPGKYVIAVIDANGTAPEMNDSNNVVPLADH
jgi:hypothetical protein